MSGWNKPVGIQVFLGKQLNDGLPCAESWWTRCPDHAALTAEAARQRHRQALPTLKDVRYDPAIAATADWMMRRALLRAGKRKAGL